LKELLQLIVSLSTSEAEFDAASQARQKAHYLRETPKDFGYQQNTTTEIYEDNLACVPMSENPMCRKVSRHINICRYFVRDLAGLGLSNSYLCAHMRWLLTPSPRDYPRPPSSS